ncbi:hypothetical protein F9U41_23600 [Pectobacterium versatile]|nr:hypothetical protein [Pectobacterium versatile]
MLTQAGIVNILTSQPLSQRGNSADNQALIFLITVDDQPQNFSKSGLIDGQETARTDP